MRKNLVLVALIGALTLGTTMNVMAAEEPSVVDQTVKDDFENEDKHVPIYCTWNSYWVDQHGHTIESYDGKKYLADHPSYATKVYDINVDLYYTPHTGRSITLRDIKKATSETDEQYNYDFVDEAAQQLANDGITIMKVIPAYEIDTVKAYMEWSGDEVKSIPVFETEDGWLDQFSEKMDQDEAEEFLQQYDDYKQELEQLTLVVELAKIGQSDSREKFESAYSRWFMQQMCYKHGLVNETEIRRPKPSTPDPVSKPPKKESKQETDTTKTTTLPEPAIERPDYSTLSNYVRYVRTNVYNAYAAGVRHEAIESLRKTEVWCDNCYALLRLSDLTNPDVNIIGRQIYGYNYPADDEPIGEIRNGLVYCAEGHVCGSPTETGEFHHSGEFSDAVEQKWQEMLDNDAKNVGFDAKK